jgi:peptidoglycan/LPS O-acetylase OafA/YrhL
MNIESQNSRPRLVALAGLRLFAALHIYLFHLMQAHQAGLLRFPCIDHLPDFVQNVLGKGFVSTGLFFQLSGFILAYVYLSPDGRMKVPDGKFLVGRIARFYPLYFISLVLLAPAPALLPITMVPESSANKLTLVLTNLTLTQAWFPDCAIAWNAPAWALSAFLPAYFLFPAFTRRLHGWNRSTLFGLLAALVVLSNLPALAFALFNPEGNGLSLTPITLGGVWLTALRFNPLVWLPQFFSGVVLAIYLNRAPSLTTDVSSTSRFRGISAGDLVALGVVLVIGFIPGIPYVFLRHGLLASLTLVIIGDLARNRGYLARLLSTGWMDRASDAGFALFALQMPVGVWFSFLVVKSHEGSALDLAGMISTTLVTALVWTQWVQRPLIRRFKKARKLQTHQSQPDYRLEQKRLKKQSSINEDQIR